MVKEHKIGVDVYGNTLHVFIGDTPEESIKYVEKKYDVTFDIEASELDGLTTSLTNKKLGRTDEILMIGKDCAKGTLSHEVIHSAWSILDYHYVKVDADNHEALAYLAGYFFKEVEKILKKYERKA